MDEKVKAILARTDCGPEEFKYIKNVFRQMPEMVGSKEFYDWMSVHKKAIIEWGKQLGHNNDESKTS